MRSPKFPIDVRVGAVCAVASVAALAPGCRLDMHDAPLYEPLEESPLWENGQSSRKPVPGTVARGHFKADRLDYFTGKTPEGMPIDGLPDGVAVDRELLETGREKYEVFCSPCHGYTGYANGMIVQRGYPQPPSFHSKRLKEVQLGHFYDVMTNGWGRMYSYGHALRPSQRWAVAAYVRALQLSQDYAVGDLTDDQRAALRGAGHTPDEREHGGGH